MAKKAEKDSKIKSLEDLQAIKARVLPEIFPEQGVRIVVGMGTCGVAAGAKKVYDTIAEEIQSGNYHNVKVEATGCVGICQFEPVVEVYEPGGTRTTYVHMTPDRTKRMMQQHIRGGNPVMKCTIGSSRNGGRA